MARLVHLNGPPGIGKSTLAALYAERHPGTLNLDVDTLHRLVGGWSDEATDTWPAVWALVRAMAATHLDGGDDVVLPQYIATADQVAGLAELARRHRADFREVVLLDDREAAIERFQRRARDSDDPWIRHHGHLAPAALGTMYDNLLAFVRLRPAPVVVPSVAGAAPETYELLTAALREPDIRPGRVTSRVPVEIRPAVPADLYRCAEMDRGTYGDDAFNPMALRQFIEVSGPLFAVAVAPGEPEVLGYVLAAPSVERELAWLLSIVVDESARGLGVGRQLTTHALDSCRAAGLSHLRATVSPGNSRSLALLRSLGLVEIAEDPDYFGRGESRKVMELSLGGTAS
jgi:ribosomal protein S18 acetylase RimI-like enzyme/predicted kinase